MRCHICGDGLHNGVALYRQNEKGVPGVWACIRHNRTAVDPEVKTITQLIERKGEGPDDPPA